MEGTHRREPVQTRHSLSLGMAHPQIRLVQAAAVPLSSSRLSPHQSHSSLPLATADSWGSQPPSHSPVSLCSSDNSKYFYAFFPPFKGGFSCFLITDIPRVTLPSGTHSEEMARKLSLPPRSLPFTSPEHIFNLLVDCIFHLCSINSAYPTPS